MLIDIDPAFPDWGIRGIEGFLMDNKSVQCMVTSGLCDLGQTSVEFRLTIPDDFRMRMMKWNWYVVYTGKNHGIYDSWEICKEQVNGYKNSWYKGYKTKKEVVGHYANYIRREAGGHYANYVRRDIEGHYVNYVHRDAKGHYANHASKEEINYEVCKTVWTSG
ncbi:hypothetical protein D1007_55962 [Hordeum vulgare]|nr:hypothetical protein D1007_55962 [Hordeum vulgare]